MSEAAKPQLTCAICGGRNTFMLSVSSSWLSLPEDLVACEDCGPQVLLANRARCRVKRDA